MQFVYISIGFVLRQVMRYRFRVSIQNIARSFPSATYQEVSQYHKSFYQNLGKLLFDNLFVRKQVLELTLNSHTLLQEIKKENRNIIIILGHFGNWELIKQLPLLIDTQVQALYKPIKDKFWNRVMLSIRQRYGLRLIPSQHALRILLKEKESNTITVFIADQFPGKENGHRVEFLNQPTYVYTGAEQIAKKLNAYVVYAQIIPIAQHKWQMSIEIICEQAMYTPKGSITESFIQKLENSIQKYPSLWLWSHKRWK